MYNNILVPLDGSERAECVLPHLESIAVGRGVKGVIFLRILDTYLPAPVRAYLTAETIREAYERAETGVRAYFDEVAGRIHLDGVEVRKHVMAGQAADSITEYAVENDVDLIIIATHGRSGVSRWVWGSVADRVLRSACVPVLMVRAPGCVPGI